MTKTIELITDNLVNEQKEGQRLYQVNTPIAMSIIGDYPIYDSDGELYKTNRIATFLDGFGDVVPFQLGNKVYLPKSSEYIFAVSENKETAFLDLVMSFKVYADNPQHAMETLADMIAEGCQLLDFSIRDITNMARYDVDILLFTISDLYKADPINENGEYIYE